MLTLRGGPFDGRETEDYEGHRDDEQRHFFLRVEFKGRWLNADMLYEYQRPYAPNDEVTQGGECYQFRGMFIDADHLKEKDVHWN